MADGLTMEVGDEALLERDVLEVGLAVVYAGYHEAGTRKMPRRVLLTEDRRSLRAW